MAEEKKGSDWLTPREHAKRSGFYRVRSRRERSREQALSEWVGDEDAAEVEIGARKAGELSLGGLCDKVLDSLDTPDRRAMRTLLNRWSEVAAGFASQCGPRNLGTNGMLYVAVASPALAFQLRMQERLFLQRIAALPVLQVKAIRFVPGGATVEEHFES